MTDAATWQPHDSGPSTWHRRHGEFELWVEHHLDGWTWMIYRIKVGEPRFVDEGRGHVTRDEAQEAVVARALVAALLFAALGAR